MSFTRSTTNTTVHQNMPDYPSGEGYTTSQLKTAFDAPATGLKADINRLATELEDTTSASNIGATAIVSGDDSAGNVQAKLNKLQEELEGITLGSIPDGSITQAKMNGTYEATLAKKDGTLQANLNAEKLNGKTETQLKTAFLATPNPTTLSFSKLDAPSDTWSETTVTESKTLNTNGSRYYLIILSGYYTDLAFYDAKSNKFAFGVNFTTTSDNAYNTATLKVYDNRATATLSASISSSVLTFNMTKKSVHNSSDNKYSVPAGTLTIFELGGMV